MRGSALGPTLQWGGATCCPHPLLALLDDGEQGGEGVIAIAKPYAHASCVTAVAVAANGCVLSADDQGRLKLWRLCVAPPSAKLSPVSRLLPDWHRLAAARFAGCLGVLARASLSRCPLSSSLPMSFCRWRRTCCTRAPSPA